MTGTQQGEAALTDWLEKLGPGAGTDTLLRFAGSTSNCIDITHAHPSGLAQFLAGRRTRLSMLLRDADAYHQARRTARALRAKIRELSEDRGIDVGYLASGLATWRAVQDGRSEQFSAPIMLGRISLTVREGQDDDEVQLAGRAQVNPALVRYLQDQQGLSIDVEALEQAAYMTARFDPRRAMDSLREQVSSLPGTVIEHRLLVSTFADLADPADPARIDTAHPVISRLLAADAGETVEVPEPEVTVLSSDERNPADESLVLDADASQQEVLDLVEAGESVVVSSPPGTGQTQTAVNAAAILAGQGKRVLVVAERRDTARSLNEKLAGLDLASMALRLSPEVGPEELRAQLIQAILRNERATEPQLGKLHQRLTEHRHALLDHVNSLHNVRERWGCSPYQAMQELARLTSMDPAPSTAVRLKRSVLDSITDRGETAVRLRRAAEVGSFTRATTLSPWYGARLRNRRETDDALALATSLADDLPTLHGQMLKVAEHSEITLGTTFAEWGAQLDLLVAVRGSLDKFEPDIFDRSVEDLISATASSSWRRERGIEMSSITRSRLRRVAKEYVRPGVHISDLHSSIVEVQQQREMWTRYATSQRHPKVPTGLLELDKAYRDAGDRLERIVKALAPAEGNGLQDLPVDDLVAKLQALVNSEEALHVLPERTLVLEQLREQGLGDLLEDLAAREVGPDEVAAELDLAWWQSALEAMISGDEYLAMSDGASLRKLEAEYRLADNTHIASGASRLRWQLAQRWKAALADHRAASRELRMMLKDGEPTVADLAGLGVGLVNALVPVWVGSPLLIPAAVPEDVEFDAVVLLDADALSLRSAIGSISRSRQVIAFGDAMLGKPRGFHVSVDPTASTREPREPASTFEALSTVLPLRRLRTVYRGVDEGLTEALGQAYYSGSLHRLPAARAMSGGTPSLSVDYVPDGTGMPGAGGEAVETTVAEVNRVVDLVFDHIRRRPRRSLAVIAANQRHAARIAEAISLQLPNHPGAQGFFKGGAEPFQVSSVERAHGLVRDAVIFSLGYGRTPHGKSLHDFGALSSERGDELFVTGVTRSRDLLHLVTAVTPEDLDLDRVSSGARQFIELVGRVRSGGSGVAGDGHPLEDPLVADLKSRLEAAGATVRERYRGVLDLAAQIADTSHGADLPLAVVSDGTDAYRRMTVRERSRLRPQLLEALGWRYIPLWTIDVFSDPASVADKMARYLGLEGEQATATPQEGDMDPTRSGRRKALDKDTAAARAADAAGRHAADPVLPTRASEDDPRRWGDSEGNHDQWLREQRPPHWG